METAALRQPQRGFSIIEVLVVFTVVAVLALIGLPAIDKMMRRQNLEGMAREATQMLSVARTEAARRSRPITVLGDSASNSLIAFLDLNEDGIQDPGDTTVVPYLQTVNKHCTMVAPGAQPIFDGFSTAGSRGWVTFQPDGSASSTGAIRFGDDKGNFLETRIVFLATGRVRVRKFEPTYAPNEDGTNWYAPEEGDGPWNWLM